MTSARVGITASPRDHPADFLLACTLGLKAVSPLSALGQTRRSDRGLFTSGLSRRSQPVDATLYLEGEMECGLMGHRFHRGFTAAEKTELWDRWKRGESLKAIGRAFGKQSSSSIFWWLRMVGFVLPSGVAPGWH